MPEITTTDLLRMQDAITGTVRYEVGQARDEFRTQLVELKAAQTKHDERAERHSRELARLEERTRTAAKTLFSSLTPKQKAAVWSFAIGAGGVLLDYGRHLAVAVLALLAKGARP
jgi:hypothetical protein